MVAAGASPAKPPDSPGDNGIYVVEGWKIVDRIDAPSKEQHVHSLDDILRGIHETQPANNRMPLDFLLHGTKMTGNELAEGDRVILPCGDRSREYLVHEGQLTRTDDAAATENIFPHTSYLVVREENEEK